MHHLSATGSAALTLVAALVVLPAAGGCSPDTEESAPGTAREVTTTLSSPGRPTDAPGDHPAPSAPRAPSAPPAQPEPPFIEGATWGDSDYGVTLKVAPSESGRRAWGPDDPRAAWQEVLHLVPDADTPGMWEQFECHWTWARLLEPDKATWNLEPWRPVVPAERMLAEGCNPGGPEV